MGKNRHLLITSDQELQKKYKQNGKEGLEKIANDYVEEKQTKQETIKALAEHFARYRES